MDPELRKLIADAVGGLARLRGAYQSWRPDTALPAVVQPFFALAAVISVAVAFGISLAALSTLLVSLLVLQFLLVDVFGLHIEAA